MFVKARDFDITLWKKLVARRIQSSL